jgi:hypothetical protein
MKGMLFALAAATAATLQGAASAGATWDYFAGGDAGFNALTNNGALERAVSEGRIGNNALNGTWEQGIWQQGGVSLKEQAQGTWISGQPVDWSFSWDGLSTVTYYQSNGTTLVWNEVAGSFTDIFIRTRSANDTTSLLLSDMAFDSVAGSDFAIGNLLSTGANDVEYIRVTDGGAPLGAFTLSGRATLTWGGAPPINSSLAWQVKFTNVVPAPAALALLGLAGVSGARRRRSA